MTDEHTAHTPRHSAMGLIVLLSIAAVIDVTLSPTGGFANAMIAIIALPGVIFTLDLVAAGIERVMG